MNIQTRIQDFKIFLGAVGGRQEVLVCTALGRTQSITAKTGFYLQNDLLCSWEYPLREIGHRLLGNQPSLLGVCSLPGLHVFFSRLLPSLLSA